MPKGHYDRSAAKKQTRGLPTGPSHRVGQAAAIKKPRKTQLENPKNAAITLEDCTWVFQHVGTREDDLDRVMREAPSPGAAGLLVKSREDKAIYKWVIDRLAPSMFKAEEDDALSAADDKAMHLAGLAEFMRREFQLRLRVFRGESVDDAARAVGLFKKDDGDGDGEETTDVDVPGCPEDLGREQGLAGVSVATDGEGQADAAVDLGDLL